MQASCISSAVTMDLSNTGQAPGRYRNRALVACNALSLFECGAGSMAINDTVFLVRIYFQNLRIKLVKFVPCPPEHVESTENTDNNYVGPTHVVGGLHIAFARVLLSFFLCLFVSFFVSFRRFLSGPYLRNYWADFHDSKTTGKLSGCRCALAR